MPQPEFTSASVRYQGRIIPYVIRRSKRRQKTIQITVNSNGEVVIAVPFRTANKRAQAVILERAPWILKQLAKQKSRPAPTQFANGETMPYLGHSLPLIVEKGDYEEANVRLEDWRFLIEVPSLPNPDELREDIRRAFVRWYWARAAERAHAGVDRWWPILGCGKRPRIIVGDQRSQWGSCAADGTLRFTWRLAMVRPSLMEYVVVHELAHLTVRNHSADFWDLVTQAMPDAIDRRRQLGEAGRALPF